MLMRLPMQGMAATEYKSTSTELPPIMAAAGAEESVPAQAQQGRAALVAGEMAVTIRPESQVPMGLAVARVARAAGAAQQGGKPEPTEGTASQW